MAIKSRYGQPLGTSGKFKVSAPYDNLIKSYRASLESMMAKHVYISWNKMKYVEVGSEHMDDAIDNITEIQKTTRLDDTPLSIHIQT